MIRLYIDGDFKSGDLLSLPATETHYLKSVRRSQGQVVIFNGRGQWAQGEVTAKGFLVHQVNAQAIQPLALDIAIGLPETNVLTSVVRQLTELGVRRLYLFPAERSQKAADRMNEALIQRLKRISIEACRQSARLDLLEVEFSILPKILELPASNKICLDEASASQQTFELKCHEASLILIGCEGGFTQRERDLMTEHSWNRLHLATSILKVDTATVFGASFALSHIFEIHKAGRDSVQ